MSRPQHSCTFHKHSNGSFTNLETTPLLPLHQTALTLFVEPKAEDPLTAQTLHQIAHDIHEFGIIKERLNWFLIYIMSILLYLGLNATLLVANSMPQTFIEEYYELPMHYLSFWGVFGFTVVEAVLLLSTSLVSLERRLASSLLFLDVCLSFGSALLYSLDPDIFEVPAHYAEYIVQILITSVNLLFIQDRQRQQSEILVQDARSDQGKDKDDATTPPSRSSRTIFQSSLSSLEQGSSYIALVLSLLQLALYSELVPTRMGGERSAHFCEFTNELINGIFALDYAIRSCQEYKARLDRHQI